MELPLSSLSCRSSTIEAIILQQRCLRCNSGDATGIGAYVGVDHARGEVVVAVRGSNNVRNFITDVVFAFQDSDLADGAKVHTGFAAAWDEISEGVTSAVSSALSENAGYRLLISGHSLGGAVATLAGAYLRRSGYPNDIYTFGSPRVGNDVFTDFVTDQTGAEYRVTHLDDPIPRLPPIIFDYRHTSPEYWLSTGGSETVEFAIGDILVCVGDANTDCNAGTDIGLDVEAHLHYFQEISGCGNAFQWKRQTTESDEEVAARLSEWARQDMDYVQNSST